MARTRAVGRAPAPPEAPRRAAALRGLLLALAAACLLAPPAFLATSGRRQPTAAARAGRRATLADGSPGAGARRLALFAAAGGAEKEGAEDAGSDGGLSEEDMAVLRRRIEEVKQGPRLPILMLDAMCPGQRLEFDSNDRRLPVMCEAGEVAVVGVWNSQPLRYGVAAELKQLGPDRWELKARDHVRVIGPAEREDDGVTFVRLEYVKDKVGKVDVEMAELLADLVEEWRGLVEGSPFEKFEGQIRGVLADLGPMPAAEDAGAVALWVAALVNPLPGLGVAYEIRPGALSAESVFDRLKVVTSGIRSSIGHVSGKRPLF